MITYFKTENFLSDDQMQEAMIEAVKEYTKEKCNKFFEGCTPENGNFRTLFESVCLTYMLDNFKPEVDHAVKCCLDYIVTTGLFKPRWHDYDNSTNRLMSEVSKRLGEHHIEFKEAILERIKNQDENNIQDMLCDVLSSKITDMFNSKAIK